MNFGESDFHSIRSTCLCWPLLLALSAALTELAAVPLSRLSASPYFITKNEPVDIIGFYSEGHSGVFLSQYAPAIKKESGMKNAIHIHLVSRTSKASGHIDDLTLGENIVLRLPEQ